MATVLKFWFIETLVLPPNTWQTEPWFAGVECYRKWDEAQEHLAHRLEHYRDLAGRDRMRWLARWQRHFGGHAPPMPADLTVCRLVEAKGQERKVATIIGKKARRTGAALGRALWTRAEKTFYLVSYTIASTRLKR